MILNDQNGLWMAWTTKQGNEIVIKSDYELSKNDRRWPDFERVSKIYNDFEQPKMV